MDRFWRDRDADTAWLASYVGQRHLTAEALEPGLLFAGCRQPKPSLHCVHMGEVYESDHHSVDAYARNPDDQIGESVQHAVLRVGVATRTDPAVKTYRPR